MTSQPLSLEHATFFKKTDIVVATILEGTPQQQLSNPENLELLLTEAKLMLSHDTVKVETGFLPENSPSTGENLALFAEEQKGIEAIIGTKLRKAGC